MPRKKGQPVRDRATILQETIRTAQRELASMEVRECFIQFLANPCTNTFAAFNNAMGEFRVSQGYVKEDWSE